MPAPVSTDTEAVSSGYVAVRFDGRMLIFDQDDIVKVDQRDCLLHTEGQRPLFSDEENGIQSTVFALSSSLSPVDDVERPLFVIARHDKGLYGLACEEVTVIGGKRISLNDLPGSLRGPQSPLRAYAQVGDHVGYYCETGALASLLPEQGE